MLKELRVKNYKSLEDVAVPLRPLTVFVGPNNAGKSNDPPALACFEEPENCIHPGLLELVVDALKSASRRSQILVTTHSPDFLNFLKDPEGLMIVEKVDGKTQCREAKDTAGVKEALKTLGLGELWYSGHLGGVP